MGRREPKTRSFKRYEITFKTGYPTGWYILETLAWNNIFVGYFSDE